VYAYSKTILEGYPRILVTLPGGYLAGSDYHIICVWEHGQRKSRAHVTGPHERNFKPRGHFRPATRYLTAPLNLERDRTYLTWLCSAMAIWIALLSILKK
jgi:hypothetical protein